MDYSLKKGGNIRYYRDFLSPQLSYYLALELLTEINWSHEEFNIYGKIVQSPRIVSSMFDPNFPEHGNKWYEKTAAFKAGKRYWTPLMEYVKNHLEKVFNVKIWYAHLNYYKTGKDHIGYHVDREMGLGGIIFSFSLGNIRRFGFRNKELNSGQPEFEIELENGSLIMFDIDAGKHNYKHSLLELRKKDTQDTRFSFGRINVTFRTVKEI